MAHPHIASKPESFLTHRSSKSVLESIMQKLILTTIMLINLAVSPVVVAQTGTGGSSTPSAGPLPAPIGHLQPTPKTVPADVYNDPQAKENAKQDAVLDRKIKGICRGC
jgi:hypothetical protein